MKKLGETTYAITLSFAIITFFFSFDGKISSTWAPTKLVNLDDNWFPVTCAYGRSSSSLYSKTARQYSGRGPSLISAPSCTGIFGGWERGLPDMMRRSGRTKRWAQTQAETGLPGRARTMRGFPRMVPCARVQGSPGFIQTLPNSICNIFS